ncbi:MAG TPA: hypothetical protein VE783_09355 [Candidatus Limnocylindrales bacterium]|jgi:hypothetical protein|nr:hypothetical protein [Candidatus Limnocylindrales bacterium]
MPRKPAAPKDDRLWIAPNFSLANRSLKAPPFKPLKREFPPLAPELDNDSSVARLLELADIALQTGKDKE